MNPGGPSMAVATAPPARRRLLAQQRAAQARAALACCHLCAHRCGVNRLAGPAGVCRAGATTRVFSAQVEVVDELELIPTFAVALSGCDMRCAFCVTGAQSWNASAGELLDVEQLAADAEQAIENGARTIMILGGEPTIHLPVALEIVAALPGEARLAWKTNAYGTAVTRSLLDGLFDVWVPDYKFGNDACAQRLAGVRNYTAVVRENILWAAGSTDVIVRHLVMPGHVECCWRPVAEWLATRIPATKVNLRTGYWPGWKAARHPELTRPVSRDEGDRAFEIARELHLNLVE